jgi:hypothetical protein
VRSIYVSLISVLSLVLVQAPQALSASGPGAAPIGIVLQATRNTGETDTKYEGTTIFDGETLTTDDASILRIRLDGPQMVMRSSSSVAEVRGIANGFSAKLMAGTVVISTQEGQLFQVFVDGVTIKPVGEAATTAQIERLSPKQMILTSQKGSLVISMRGEAKTLNPGDSYRLELRSDSDAEPQTAPVAPGDVRLATAAVIGFPIVIGVVAWRALVSPHKP